VPPPKPDIAIKEKPKPKEPPKPKDDPFEKLMAEEEKRMTAQRQIAEEERRIRQQRDAQAASQAAAARNKALASYTDRIRAKIKGNIVMPPGLRGNPSAIFEVVQLPSGEVISLRLTKPSGQPAWDDAVERAIHKSSPLPRPDDPGVFQRDLRLTFCPIENGVCN
jgi:colicin import membrane protein